METVNLGMGGLKVSRLCLGTMIFGAQVAEEPAFAILDKAKSREGPAAALHSERHRRRSVQPLAGGMLTGKYRRGEEPPEGTRFAREGHGPMYRARYWSELMFDVAEAVAEVAAELGRTPAQVALAWLLARPDVAVPLVGGSRPEQLE